MSNPRPQVAWRRSVAAAALLIVLSQAVYVPLLGLRVFGRGAAVGVAACLVVGVLTALALWGVLALVRGAGPAELRTVGLAPARRVPSSVGLFFAASILSAPLAFTITEKLGLHGSTEISFHHRSEAFRIFVPFAAVVLAPWVEEVSMRGLLFTALHRRLGLWPAAVLSGAVWASLHLTGGVLVIFTVEGVLLALLRVRTGSVLPGVAIHGCWNALATSVSGERGAALVYGAIVLASVAAAALALRGSGPGQATPRSAGAPAGR